MVGNTFTAHGKLLLTSEYFVLDGATALAIPTQYHQTLEVTPNTSQRLVWNSYDEHANLWFDVVFSEQLDIINTSSLDRATPLQRLLQYIQQIHPNFNFGNTTIITKLNFNRHFGLGTSSTLISLLAQWTNTNPYHLLAQSFGGSGYDVACATATTPILYAKQSPTSMSILPVDFFPPYYEHIYFVYLGKKQNSREGIAHYRQLSIYDKDKIIKELDSITQQLLISNSITTTRQLIDEHETIISTNLHQTKVKDLFFSDFNGSIKSLGAWGGDFIMAISEQEPSYIMNYFTTKNYNNIIPFSQMVRN